MRKAWMAREVRFPQWPGRKLNWNAERSQGELPLIFFLDKEFASD